MKVRVGTVVPVLLLTVVLASMAAAQAQKAAGQRFTGIVSDSMCGEKHTMLPGRPDADCVRECVKNGAKFALLIPGGHVYFLQGKSAELDKLAAQKVTITGRLDGNTIEVASVVAARK